MILKGKPRHALFLNADESMKLLANSSKSLIRFGDGEFCIMNNRDIHYQKANKELAEELETILTEYDDPKTAYFLAMPKKYFTCSWIFYLLHWKQMKYWLYSRRVFIERYDRDVKYLDAFMFSKENVKKYQSIWKDQKVRGIVLVHNSKIYADRLSISTGKPVKYVAIPSKNAYDDIDSIVQNIKLNHEEGMIVLVSAGPCGKAIISRLSIDGIRCIDTGHCFDFPLEVV